jgi:AraC family transcriptional activator of tynA and feaB
MRVWNTAGERQTDRRSYWSTAIRQAIYELDFHSDDPLMSAQLTQVDLGVVRLSSLSIGSAHEIHRSPDAVRRSAQPYFNLNYVRSGSFRVRHCGRELDVGAGEMVLLDNRHPYYVWSAGKTKHISVHIPVEWLRSQMAAPEAGVAQVITEGSPWQTALAAMLREAPNLPSSFIGAGELGARQIAGGLALALGRVASSHSDHSRLLFLRAQEVISTRYHEEELGAGAVADALGISVRYVYQLFAREQTTLGREILRIRLERAAASIREEQFANLSIAEISWRCGFADPSYFSKCFRARYNTSPGAYRLEQKATERMVG